MARRFSGQVIVETSDDLSGRRLIAIGPNKEETIIGDAYGLTSGRASVNIKQRMVGLTAGTSDSNNYTRCVKTEAESHFDRVRIHIYNRQATTPTAFTAVVAATETAATDTTTNLFDPVVGGTAYAALAGSGAYGWKEVTFGGASSGDFASAGASYRPAKLTSDWIDLSSVPRADGGTRPLVMCRVYHNGGTGGAMTIFGQLTSNASADSTSWSSTSVYPWHRIWQAGTVTTGDAVSTLTTKPAALSNASIWIAFEFASRYKGLTVLSVGDSVTEGTGHSWGGYGSWIMRACALSSSITRPVSLIQNGISGQAGEVYTLAAEDAITAHSPTHVFYPTLTLNDGDTTDASIQLARSRIQRMLQACESVGARLVMWSALPNGVFTAAGDARAIQLQSDVLEMARAGACDYIDLASIVSNGASPRRLNSFNQFDSNHPNNSAQDRLALAAMEYLQSAGR